MTKVLGAVLLKSPTTMSMLKGDATPDQMLSEVFCDSLRSFCRFQPWSDDDR